MKIYKNGGSYYRLGDAFYINLSINLINISGVQSPVTKHEHIMGWTMHEDPEIEEWFKRMDILLL